VIDINVTAGSVKYIAAFHVQQDDERINETVFFSLSVYALLGVLGGLGLFFGAHVLVTRVFAVPAALVPEAVATLRLAAFGFFLGQLQSYLQSVPQSLMRYDIASRIEMLFGTGVPLLTVAVLMLGHGLFDVILLRVAASAVNCLILWRCIRQLLPRLRYRRPGAAIRRELLGFSAYSFLSRFATLSYAYADKLIIGALVGVTGLADLPGARRTGAPEPPVRQGQSLRRIHQRIRSRAGGGIRLPDPVLLDEPAVRARRAGRAGGDGLVEFHRFADESAVAGE
jgi:O-antigen/teichoic acid export membrane protein